MDPTQVAAWYETDRSEPIPMSRPAWMTKRRALVAALALLMLLPLISIWVRATHPRDEADFILAARADAPVAQADLGTAKPTAVMGLSDADLLAEGDFACRWLGLQPRAWWNHGPWYDRGGVLNRYLRETRPVAAGQWGPPEAWTQTRGVVADAAWSQLCAGTWWWHRPHGPRGGGRGGGGGGGD